MVLVRRKGNRGLKKAKTLKIKDLNDEKNVQNNADNDDKSTDYIDLRTLFLDIAFCRAVSLSLGRSAYASQRHQLIPPFIQFPLAVSRL